MIVPDRTAVVLVDLMTRIVALPTAPYTGAEVLRRCVTLADGLRPAGATVVWVRVERPGVDEQPPGSELSADVVRQPGDLEIVKRTVGAFAGTDLDAALRERGVDTLVLGGIATNWGVESTARVADDHGYTVVFAHDAMTGLDGESHAFAVEKIFPRIGTVATTAEILAPVTAP
jgi:nicotinamidase-related amidase